MKTLEYPVLHLQRADGQFIGILLGGETQAVAGSREKLLQKIQQHLRQDYRRYGIFPQAGSKRPRLKVLKVLHQPTYWDNRGVYPLPYTLPVPIPTIYGPHPDGHFECYLPIFGQRFTYFDERHLQALATHIANNRLNNMTPEEVFQYMEYTDAELSFVSLRVHDDEDGTGEWKDDFYQRRIPQLKKLAEQYPFPRAVRRHLSMTPDAAWELEDKVEEVVDKILSGKANVLLAGPPGAGKSAVLQQAIRRIETRTRHWKPGPTFWRIIPQRLTAGAKYLGEWQEQVESLVEELERVNGILWVIAVARMLEIGGEGPEDSVAAFIGPLLQQRKLQIIGEVSPQELESIRRFLPGFAENFQIVYLETLPEEKIQRILERFAEFARQRMRIPIDREALDMSYRLLQRFFPYEQFPGKAIRFLGRCISDAQIAGRSLIDKQAVVSTFRTQTGLPELFLRDDIPLDEEELRQFFQQRIVGQPRATEQLQQLVKIFKTGLNNPDRPIATLIFAGPTGVGKTASAKALADYFFGKGQRKSPLIRIDMSEFQHAFQIYRLIGQGRESGQLIKEVRERPFSVLLLDEIEKADRSIFDALLGVLDEGILVDAFGRITNFRNTIIIMTSNLGAAETRSVGFTDTTHPEELYQSAIRRYFRPEFVNRIDGVVLFDPLGPREVERICRKELKELRKREGFIKNGIQLEYSEALIQRLIRVGFDPRYGARPLQRAIEQYIVNPFARWLLEEPRQQCTVRLDYTDELTFSVLEES